MLQCAPITWPPKAVNRTGWPRGAWDEEPDFETWIDLDTGMQCAAVRHSRFGDWRGYVAVAPDHPLHGRDYMDLEDVMGLGDVTYSGYADGSELFWFGFYFGGKSNLMPGYVRETQPGMAYRTLPEARAACGDLALALRLARD